MKKITKLLLTITILVFGINNSFATLPQDVTIHDDGSVTSVYIDRVNEKKRQQELQPKMEEQLQKEVVKQEKNQKIKKIVLISLASILLATIIILLIISKTRKLIIAKIKEILLKIKNIPYKKIANNILNKTKKYSKILLKIIKTYFLKTISFLKEKIIKNKPKS